MSARQWWLDDVGSRVDDDCDLDIATDRVRIGTHSVCLGYDLLSLVAIEFWQAGAELDGERHSQLPLRSLTIMNAGIPAVQHKHILEACTWPIPQ